MRLPFFNFKGSDKYAEVRKGTQNSGGLITWFPNVGNFHDIDSHSVLSGSGGRAVPDCGTDKGKSPFPWAELWFSLLLTGFNVWGPGRALGERRASGWKLCCEGRTPTASQGPPPSPLEPSHQLAGSLLSAPWAQQCRLSVWRLSAMCTGAVCHCLEPTCPWEREALWARGSLCENVDMAESIDSHWGSCTSPRRGSPWIPRHRAKKSLLWDQPHLRKLGAPCGWYTGMSDREGKQGLLTTLTKLSGSMALNPIRIVEPMVMATAVLIQGSQFYSSQPGEKEKGDFSWFDCFQLIKQILLPPTIMWNYCLQRNTLHMDALWSVFPDRPTCLSRSLGGSFEVPQGSEAGGGPRPTDN